MPEDIEEEEFSETRDEAMEGLEDEEDRSGQQGGSGQSKNLQEGGQKGKVGQQGLLDGDLATLKRKFPWLVDFSDSFIRAQSMEAILKMESTAMKMKLMERKQDYDDKLACNKMALGDRMVTVRAGEDNRWTLLHDGRFLAGATCSASRMWLTARERIGVAGHAPVGSYDLGAVGMGGLVTSRGWVELHNPSSCKISLRMFSINNCGARAGSYKMEGRDSDLADIVELGEFKLALRALRVAMSFAMPWNMSVLAIENFLIQNNYCSADFGNADNPAMTLTQFVDYVLGENSNKWRDSESFLSCGDLKATWDTFFSNSPKSLMTLKAGKQQQKPTGHGQGQSQGQSQSSSFLTLGKRKWVDICFDWNAGKCLKAQGACQSMKGTPLRHVCNWIPDKSKPNIYCEKTHIRSQFH
jgi:hypothetical protein